jgi:hypothetical protein
MKTKMMRTTQIKVQRIFHPLNFHFNTGSFNNWEKADRNLDIIFMLNIKRRSGEIKRDS